jgi:hypothetical protein
MSNSLLEKLKIRDFVCRGRGVKALDIRESYYLTYQAMHSGLQSQFKQNLAAQGLTPEMLSVILEADPEMINNIMEQNTSLLESINVEDLDLDKQQIYNSNIETINKVEEALKGELTETDKQALQTNLDELLKQNLALKQTALQSKIQSNPEKFNTDPKFIRTLVKIISEEKKIEPIIKDNDGILFNLQEQLIEAFLIGKGFDQKVIEKILIGADEMSLSKEEFITLCEEIGKEKENACTAESEAFFTSMRSL